MYNLTPQEFFRAYCDNILKEREERYIKAKEEGTLALFTDIIGLFKLENNCVVDRQMSFPLVIGNKHYRVEYWCKEPENITIRLIYEKIKFTHEE